MNQPETLNDINKLAIEILFKEIGLSRTLRFLNQFSNGRGEYVEMKGKIFQGETVDEIAEQIMKRNKY